MQIVRERGVGSFNGFTPHIERCSAAGWEINKDEIIFEINKNNEGLFSFVRCCFSKNVPEENLLFTVFV